MRPSIDVGGILQQVGEGAADQRRSQLSITGPVGQIDVIRRYADARSAAGIRAWRQSSTTSSSCITGAGMRAKAENSSTIRPISPTWRTIVSVQTAKVSGSSTICFRYLRFSRSAESWIGVSGFLISWAMRRATSAQAALRWAPTEARSRRRR